MCRAVKYMCQNVIQNARQVKNKVVFKSCVVTRNFNDYNKEVGLGESRFIIIKSAGPV